MNNCIFCNIIKGELSAEIVYEDSHILAILDIDPISDGHTLILPRADVKDIFSLTEIDGGRILAVAKKLAKVIMDQYHYDTIMIMQVNGLSQDHPHFHLHVFGRNKRNDLQIHYPIGVNKDSRHLHQIAQNIQNKLMEADLS